ncbi:MAG: succinate--CoA ligase subunit alpha [Gemmatimonadota bacterium]
MSIFIDGSTRLVVQGITGRDGSFHTRQMMEYGTQVVAGVTPGKGGQSFDGSVPVFDTVVEAVTEEEANTSVVYVPAAFAADAILEAAEAGIELIVCISEGVPVQDMMRVGVVSRSGTLTYEVVFQLTRAGIGQTTCVGIGGDPLIGTDFVDCLEAFESDPDTQAVCMIGEIGGTDEQVAAEFVRDNMSKPVVGFIAGRTAPPGRRMGHAGAIISGSEGTADEKMRAFRECGIAVAELPADFVRLVQASL